MLLCTLISLTKDVSFYRYICQRLWMSVGAAPLASTVAHESLALCTWSVTRLSWLPLDPGVTKDLPSHCDSGSYVSLLPGGGGGVSTGETPVASRSWRCWRSISRVAIRSASHSLHSIYSHCLAITLGDSFRHFSQIGILVHNELKY